MLKSRVLEHGEDLAMNDTNFHVYWVAKSGVV
jgi:hypothetical protein